MTLKGLSRTAVVLATTLLLTTASASEADPKSKRRDREAAATALSQRIAGPKRTVAVSRFATKTDFMNFYGQTDVGGGLAAMLATALVDSGQFIVVERATLSDALEEQNLKNAGLINAESGPSLGNLIGAELLIQGAVTQFSQSSKGGGFGVGLPGRGILKNIGLSPQFRRGTVGLDVRLVNTTTGEVVASHSVVETIKGKALKVSMDVKDVALSQNAFSSTPIGKAARAAVDEIVRRLALEAARRPWTGRVVEFEFGEVVINAGVAAGVRVGDTFALQRTMRVLTDPVTGKVLGKRSADIGQVHISAVEEGMAFGSFEAWLDTEPQRGDLVVQR